jgi:DNA-binding NarL/FixJ family response regulator
MANKPERALSYLDTAGDAESSESDAYEVTWGRFVAAARLERPEAIQLLPELDAMAAGIPDRELRRASARMVVSCRMGTLEGLDELFHATDHLLPRAHDPLIRSSFLLSQAHFLSLTAQYRQALHSIERLFEEVSVYGLGFAQPHALMVKAFIHLGLRQFSQAASLLSITERAGEERQDVFIAMNSGALRARLLLLQGASERAVSLLGRSWNALPERSMHAEYLATRALTLAVDGQYVEALAQVKESSALSKGIEAAVLNAATRALADVHENRSELERSVDKLFETATRTRNYDGLLLACRLSSELLDRLASSEIRRELLAKVVEKADDQKLARQIGVRLPPRPTTECLTPREQEVYELLAHGLTNKEIAAALFISEPTAKRHTLHVREKLGLRSRTEVALHANVAAGTMLHQPPSHPPTRDPD